MAEREGFEPPIPVKVWPLSRRLVSTTHAPLRISGKRILGRFTRSPAATSLRISAAGSDARKAPQLSRRLVSTTHAPLRISGKRIVGPSTRSPAATSLRISAAGSDARKAPQLSRRLVSTTHAPLRISGKRICGSFDSVACCDLAQDFGCGLGRPQSASTFEAARFNHSRTSPHQRQTNFGSFDSVACCDLAQDFGCGLGRPQSASTFEAARFNHSRTSPHQRQTNCRSFDGRRRPRSGFRLRARTPAKRLNFRGGSFQPLTHLSASAANEL